MAARVGDEESFQISQLIEGVNKRGEKSPSVACTSLRQDCNTNTHTAQSRHSGRIRSAPVARAVESYTRQRSPCEPPLSLCLMTNAFLWLWFTTAARQVRDLTGKDLSNELSAWVCYQPPAMRITLSEPLIGCDLYLWKLSTFLSFSFNASKVSLQQELKISQAVTEIYFIVPEKDKKAWQKTQETGLTETLLCNANIQFPALQIKTTAARRGRFPLFVHPPPSVNERSPRNGFLCDCNINMINWNRDAGVSFHPRQTVISRIPRYPDFSPLRARIIGVELKMPRQVGSCSTSKWISAACCERV